VSQLSDLQQKLVKATGSVQSTRPVIPVLKEKEGASKQKEKEEKKKEENQLAKSVIDRYVLNSSSPFLYPQY
jgi:COP9 signalosome complex subunit 5